MLIDAGIATEEQLEQVYEEQERTGVPFTDSLYNFGIIQEHELLQMIADNLGTEFIDLKTVEPHPSVLELVPANIVRMYGILPVYEEDEVLYVVAVEPMNFRMIDELHYVIGKEVIVRVARPDDIMNAIEHFYPEGMNDSMTDLIAEMHDFEDDFDEEDDSDLEELMNSTPIVRFVNVILYQAVKDLASDIHFEPFADEFKIRYRIDGALYEMTPPPKHLANPVISRVKVISGLDIAERRLPQDGRITLRVAGRKIDLRVSTLPTQYGESVVLRVLDKSVVSLDLDAIGLPDQMKEDLRTLIAKPNGIVLVTGPTGSGKTTTLYSCLKEINSIEDKILTAEDPVEYNIEGLMQVPINEAVGMTFAKALRSFLRQDPDRIMLGEIRDLETAQMAIQASLTGHLVLSTLHTNDAPGAITRLVDMGVEPFLITSSVEGILAQRLVRRICVNCKISYDPTDVEFEALGLDRDEVGDIQFAYGKGCKECNDTGYRGRKGIYELFILTPIIREMVNNKEPASVLTAKAHEEGMRSLREDGIRSIIDEISTVEEVLKYT
ncbi:MAG TPA: pilus assembly protein PilB [Lentisphaeria bacterium]|nr:pilus assembly protein PilB [Lentisphaeria bacterium]